MYKEVISEQEWGELKQRLGLSRQQTDIARRLLCGKLCHELARKLGLSPRMVRTQTERLYRQFRMSGQVHPVMHVLASLRDSWRLEEESFHT